MAKNKNKQQKQQQTVEEEVQSPEVVESQDVVVEETNDTISDASDSEVVESIDEQQDETTVDDGSDTTESEEELTEAQQDTEDTTTEEDTEVVVEEVQSEQEVEEPVLEDDSYEAPVVEVVEAQVEPTFEETEVVKYVNFDVVCGEDKVFNNEVVDNATAVFSILYEKIDRHFDYIAGRLGFRSKQEQETHQLEFIETIGVINRMKYKEHCEVTQYLLERISSDSKLFTDSTAFRYLRGLEAKMNVNTLRAYQGYMTYLFTVSANWNKRHNLKSIIDINTVVSTLPKDAKTNIVKLFEKMVNN